MFLVGLRYRGSPPPRTPLGRARWRRTVKSCDYECLVVLGETAQELWGNAEIRDMSGTSSTARPREQNLRQSNFSAEHAVVVARFAAGVWRGLARSQPVLPGLHVVRPYNVSVTRFRPKLARWQPNRAVSREHTEIPPRLRTCFRRGKRSYRWLQLNQPLRHQTRRLLCPPRRPRHRGLACLLRKTSFQTRDGRRTFAPADSAQWRDNAPAFSTGCFRATRSRSIRAGRCRTSHRQNSRTCTESSVS